MLKTLSNTPLCGPPTPGVALPPPSPQGTCVLAGPVTGHLLPLRAPCGELALNLWKFLKVRLNSTFKIQPLVT